MKDGKHEGVLGVAQLEIDPIWRLSGRTRHKMMQTEIQEAAKQGPASSKLRLDFLAKAPDFKRLLADKPCPLVATVRRPQDGGRWSGTERHGMALLRQAIVAGFDWVDLETDVADRIRRFKDVKHIISYHNIARDCRTTWRKSTSACAARMPTCSRWR